MSPARLAISLMAGAALDGVVFGLHGWVPAGLFAAGYLLAVFTFPRWFRQETKP